MKNPIGVLDSGIGGLSVFSEIKKLLPQESIVYVGDSKNVPYSSKPDDEILELSKKMINFLLGREVKIIVIACNTITVSALDRLRQEFDIPIIGTVPVIKTAVKLTKNGKIGVFSTKKTAESRYQKRLIEDYAQGVKVINLGSDKIAPLIEKGMNTQEILKKELKPLTDFGVDILALGCTHYPLVMKEIKKIMGSRVLIIDSGEAIARQVKRVLGKEAELSNSTHPSYTFYTSGDVNRMKNVLNKLKLKGGIFKYGSQE